MSKLNQIFAAFALASVAVIAVAPHSSANSQGVVVSLRGYDLTDKQDRQRLTTQIERAAETVCGMRRGRMTLEERGAAERCKAQAQAKAMIELEKRFPQRVAGLN